MKISLNWLKQFIDIPKTVTPEELGLALTLKTVEIEGVEKQGKYLKNVVVGKVKEAKKHPNADKLKICIVDVGKKEPVQIVCGGINLREGMLVAVAKIGAKVKWHGEEEVTMEKVKIRGEESNGMICAAAELGLENIIKQEHEAEIVDLEKYQVSSIKYQAGQKLAEVFGMDDVIFDIDNKSITHRPDLWGHYGIAREIAAIYGVDLKGYGEKNNFQFLPRVHHRGLISNFNSTKDKTNKSRKKMEISVTVKDSDLCPRYMAIAMSGVKIGQSPQWMQNRLLAVGMRPMNNIVDITNFVMLELGQPMHAFSKSKISAKGGFLHAQAVASCGKNQKACHASPSYWRELAEGSKIMITVRNAEEGEKIITLDGEKRELDENMLVIADKEKPIAIAGVMGCANSEIDENTAEIILESANFEKVNNRKTAAELGLRTEASTRYEKGLDSNLCEQALARCVELIREIIPGAIVASDVVDIAKKGQISKESQYQIEISLDYIRKKMGIEIEGKRVVGILESLGFGVEIPSLTPHCEGGDGLVPLLNKEGLGVVFKITVPSWRATGDISIPDDIVEEVARIYGYDHIEPKMPEISLKPPLKNKEKILERRVKNILSVGFEMTETSNYSFINEKQLENLGIYEKCVKLSNPLSLEHTLLRPSLIPNLLKNVKDNLRFFDEFSMFEIGSVFLDEVGDIERRSTPAINAGDTAAEQCKSQVSNSKFQVDFLPWQEKFIAGIFVMGKNAVPFFKAKGAAVGLLRDLGVDFDIITGGNIERWFHPYRTAIICADKTRIATRNSRGNLLGYVTELNPIIAEEIGIKNNARVGIFNLSLNALLEFSSEEKLYDKLPKYPSIIRDLAVIVDKKTLYRDIEGLIYKTDKLIKKAELFDIFENEKLGKDKKSMALHITFYGPERTLTSGEVEIIFKKIVDKLEKKFGAEIRK